MGNVLGTIYCFFNSFFGVNLEAHLWGFDGVNYSNSIAFNAIGIMAILTSLFMVITYYYIINHPRFYRWWSWLIVLIINGTVNLFIGYSWTINDLNNGVIADSLMFLRDVNGDIVSELIYSSDCWGFGISNFILATIFFVIFSFILKWWSSNCKYSPF